MVSVAVPYRAPECRGRQLSSSTTSIITMTTTLSASATDRLRGGSEDKMREEMTTHSLLDGPPLTVGDLCRLIGGSPLLTVVGVDSKDVVVAWPSSEDGSSEKLVSRDSLKREAAKTAD